VDTQFQLDLKGSPSGALTAVVIPDAAPAPLATPSTTPTAVAPVVIDLGSDGIEFLSRSAGVRFDYTGDGSRQATAWFGPQDGLLAYDVNLDGAITDAKEFVFTRWAPEATTDLEALALAFDSNQDGQLSALDAEWSKFGLWIDANSNAVNEAGEFVSLSDLGIRSINLDYQAGSLASVAADGDVTIAGTALVTWDDGQTTQAADASFLTDQPITATATATEGIDPLIGIPVDGSVPIAYAVDDQQSELPWTNDVETYIANLMEEIYSDLADDGWQSLLDAHAYPSACDGRPLDRPDPRPVDCFQQQEPGRNHAGDALALL
jgi:hypothetical protein